GGSTWPAHRSSERIVGGDMRLLKLIPVALAFAPLVLGSFALAATSATKDEAVAMVKKAVTAIKSEGPDKALSRCRRSVAVNVAGNRRHAAADATAQVRNEPARSSLKCGRRSK